MENINILAVLVIVLLGLFIPYLVLKFGFKSAHFINPEEKETLTLSDLPKDQEQIARQKHG